MLKDLNIVVNTAKNADGNIPLTTVIADSVRTMINDGMGENDVTDLIKFYENEKC
jgi:3-hydroxyisobutyrate dehydrogenase-like beta-hydroxyacid dehydrogenase